MQPECPDGNGFDSRNDPFLNSGEQTMPASKFKMVNGPDQPVADQIAITSLLNQYCHAVDWGSVDAIAALFTDDAIQRPLHEGPEVFQGRAAIRAWYDIYDKRVRAGRRHRLHRIMA